MQTLAELEALYSSGSNVTFKEMTDGFIVAEINTRIAQARIAIQGAQVLTWHPVGEQPVIWMSKAAKYVHGKSVRGGVPVCWPWFGPHVRHADYPAHGIARNNIWQLTDVHMHDDETVQLQLEFDPLSVKQSYWRFNTPLTLTVTAGEYFEMELLTQNKSDQPIQITEALHTYFAVSHIDKILVHGLEDNEYIDKVDNGNRKIQTSPVSFQGEVDSVYVNSESNCVIEDKGWERSIIVNKQNSRSTVVWNPWVEKARALGDMGENGYQSMVCVESANALENEVTIEPGTQHSLYVKYSLLK